MMGSAGTEGKKERGKKMKKRKREGDGFMGLEERGYWGGQDLKLITLDRHECFSVFHHPQKDKQREQRHSLKLGKKRRESSKRNYYIFSSRVIIKAIIIIWPGKVQQYSQDLDDSLLATPTSQALNRTKGKKRWKNREFARHQGRLFACHWAKMTGQQHPETNIYHRNEHNFNLWMSSTCYN